MLTTLSVHACTLPRSTRTSMASGSDESCPAMLCSAMRAQQLDGGGCTALPATSRLMIVMTLRVCAPQMPTAAGAGACSSSVGAPRPAAFTWGLTGGRDGLPCSHMARSPTILSIARSASHACTLASAASWVGLRRAQQAERGSGQASCKRTAACGKRGQARLHTYTLASACRAHAWQEQCPHA